MSLEALLKSYSKQAIYELSDNEQRTTMYDRKEQGRFANRTRLKIWRKVNKNVTFQNYKIWKLNKLNV